MLWDTYEGQKPMIALANSGITIASTRTGKSCAASLCSFCQPVMRSVGHQDDTRQARSQVKENGQAFQLATWKGKHHEDSESGR